MVSNKYSLVYPNTTLPSANTNIINNTKTSFDRKNVDYTVYEEGIYVGYRWFDTQNIEVSYPFGYGLSYTTFELSGAKVVAPGKVKVLTAEKPLKVAIKIKNTGASKGAEVIQLYVAEKNPVVARPVKELKAFKKVTLDAGASEVVVFEVDKSMCQFWCDKSHAWSVKPGDFEIMLGTSSANIVATLPISVQ